MCFLDNMESSDTLLYSRKILPFQSNYTKQLQISSISARNLKNKSLVFNSGLGFHSKKVEPLCFNIYSKFLVIVFEKVFDLWWSNTG